jgi:hypothetical protein
MNDFEVKDSRNGLGGFTTVSFRKGGVVYDWSECERFTQADLPSPYTDDRFLQVAPNYYVGSFMGPKSQDDFFNHSCDPNCVVVFDAPKIHLIALRDIAVGEEITYDYALTIFNDAWQMSCNCGATKCRRIVEEPAR